MNKVRSQSNRMVNTTSTFPDQPPTKTRPPSTVRPGPYVSASNGFLGGEKANAIIRPPSNRRIIIGS